MLKVSKQNDSSAPETSTTSGASSAPDELDAVEVVRLRVAEQEHARAGPLRAQPPAASTDAVRISSSAKGNPNSRSTVPNLACG